MVELDEKYFEKFKEFVNTELDFSVRYYNEEYIKRRLRSRIRRKQCDNLEQYFQILIHSEEEQKELLQAFSINVTSFFRNNDVWGGVRELLREKTQNGECHVWSAGCSDGREPYSIALVALDDNRIDDSKVKITGTDINEEVLEKARKARYENTITDKISEQMEYISHPERFTIENEDYFELTDEVKDKVTFKKHDLIRDPVNDKYEIILCRNVLIYLEREHEDDIIQTIATAMHEDSHLIIGKADSLPPGITGRFTTTDSSLRIYKYRGGN